MKKLTCELCNTEHFILIKIEVASDTWMSPKGICTQCFKNGDIDERIFLHHKNFIQKQIDGLEDQKKIWQEELKKNDFRRKLITKNMEIEFTDRYKAMGIPYPNPKTMCKGQCEGTGVVPHKKYSKEGEPKMLRQDIDEVLDELWEEAHKKHRGTKEGDLCDGWHFVKCPDCNGTGKKLV